uniref:Uncharacterized protein n=1 Tax=Zooxanthella nutricula TaxID=1333877 RepID=A0A7S2NZS3_9DINO|mmetsp:Transcript_43403/g.131189  ORF Transcript_43403/g.131189 Transcript_43403/m.131189 type:complete len:139 (+) Transcript_43403:105-521(+)
MVSASEGDIFVSDSASKVSPEAPVAGSKASPFAAKVFQMVGKACRRVRGGSRSAEPNFTAVTVVQSLDGVGSQSVAAEPFVVVQRDVAKAGGSKGDARRRFIGLQAVGRVRPATRGPAPVPWRRGLRVASSSGGGGGE